MMARRTEIIGGVEWFYFFVPNNETLSLIEATPDYSARFLVCLHLDNPGKKGSTKMYASFKTYLDFLTYIRDIPHEYWNFFEYIMENQRQKPYIDIDLHEDYVPPGYPGGIEAFAQRLLNLLISRIVEVFQQKKLPFEISRNILLFSSHGQTKKSYHLVIDGYFVWNNRENADCIAEILKGIPREFIQTKEKNNIIDLKLYSSKQQFRLYGSQKAKSRRPKIFIPRFKVNDVWYQHDLPETRGMSEPQKSLLEFSYIFQKSCITFTSNCQPISSPLTPLGPSVPSVPSEIDSETLKKVLELLPSKLNSEVWGISDRNEESGRDIIHLRRKKPAYCVICDRIHDHENAFVSVSRMGDISLHCWRAEESKGISLGWVETKYLDETSKDHFMSVRERYASYLPVPEISQGPKIREPELPYTGNITKSLRERAICCILKVT